EIIPMEKVDQEEIAELYVKWIICRHRASKVLLSDRGRQFMNKLMKKINKFLKVDQHFTSAYYTQTNGLTERFNKTLEEMLSMFVNAHQDNWDEYIPYLEFAHHTSIHES